MKAKKWWQKVLWGRLSCIIPVVAGCMCICAGVEAVLVKEYLTALYLLTAVSVNVFTIVAIWTFTGGEK
jgi:hypothetical protein